MIDPHHQRLSIARQCALVSIARSSFYYQGKGESPLNLALMRQIDAQFLETPWYGSRQMARHLRRQGYAVGRKRVRRLMRVMGLTAIYQKPRTSRPDPTHRIYPYLLRGLTIERADQVWCTDVSYIPMRHGFLYLVAIMDWWSRRVLSWRLSNTLDVEFCVEALEEALARHGRPEIFNTDQGCQFTSVAFTQVLKGAGVKISMDGRGRWMDNRASHPSFGCDRTAVAQLEIRVRLLASLRDGRRGSGRDRLLDQLLQHLKTTLGVRWTDTGRGLYWTRRAISGTCPGDGAKSAGGLKFIIGSHLIKAAELSKHWGPPQPGRNLPTKVNLLWSRQANRHRSD